MEQEVCNIQQHKIA
ncbi:unnamed protein product [Allacma fusca]|uniref:Uncharacterized protein n=1 Tax=Allacma fusca TaxID=39272 RepID=A0A8J2PJD8_9HEXA|nr:unnamed protein product [Allacma fusca]